MLLIENKAAPNVKGREQFGANNAKLLLRKKDLFMKKLSILKMGIVLIPLMLTSCNNYSYPEFGPKTDGSKYNIGILLPVTHDALENAANGFKQGLKEKGWEEGKNIAITTKNAEGKDDDLRTMAKSLIANNVLTLGLGTGATEQLKAAQKNRGSKNPILFSAVTDPVGAGFAKSLEKPEGLITGSSDAQPIEGQVDLIKEVLPSADKVGIFYTISESNSEAQALQAKAEIEAQGMSAIIRTCTDKNDLVSSLASLLTVDGLDAIYLPTDNNVASEITKVRDAAKGKGVLLVGGEVGMLSGAHITISVDYTKLGKQAGEMAAQILNGDKKPEDLPVYIMPAKECGNFFSSANLADSGVSLDPAVLANFTDVDLK